MTVVVLDKTVHVRYTASCLHRRCVMTVMLIIWVTIDTIIIISVWVRSGVV